MKRKRVVLFPNFPPKLYRLSPHNGTRKAQYFSLKDRIRDEGADPDEIDPYDNQTLLQKITTTFAMSCRPDDIDVKMVCFLLSNGARQIYARPDGCWIRRQPLFVTFNWRDYSSSIAPLITCWNATDGIMEETFFDYFLRTSIQLYFSTFILTALKYGAQPSHSTVWYILERNIDPTFSNEDGFKALSLVCAYPALKGQHKLCGVCRKHGTRIFDKLGVTEDWDVIPLLILLRAGAHPTCFFSEDRREEIYPTISNCRLPPLGVRKQFTVWRYTLGYFFATFKLARRLKARTGIDVNIWRRIFLESYLDHCWDLMVGTWQGLREFGLSWDTDNSFFLTFTYLYSCVFHFPDPFINLPSPRNMYERMKALLGCNQMRFKSETDLEVAMSRRRDQNARMLRSIAKVVYFGQLPEFRASRHIGRRIQLLF